MRRISLILGFVLLVAPSQAFPIKCPEIFKSIWSYVSGTRLRGPVNPDGPGYGVVQRELEQDVRKGVLFKAADGTYSYADNVTRRPIEKLIKENGSARVLDPSEMDAEAVESAVRVRAMFVVTATSEVVLGLRTGPAIYRDYEGRIRNMPHPTLATTDGSISRVLAAGEVLIEKGKIVQVNRQSGHYRPGPESFEDAKKAFEPYRDLFLNWEGAWKNFDK